MGQIRLYRKIYCVNITPDISGQTQSYALISPYSLSANTFVAGTGATESATTIETGTLVVQESTGIYYTDLNPTFYATDVTYDLVWYIQYTNSAPIKKLTTRFRLNNQNGPSGELSIVIEQREINLEIFDNTIEIEII